MTFTVTIPHDSKSSRAQSNNYCSSSEVSFNMFFSMSGENIAPHTVLLLTRDLGKSTYLRQVGLLTVMAMCGCFVPAEYASFRYVRSFSSSSFVETGSRIHDALLTRLSNDDDMEKNLSTFASEMASSAMILGSSRSYLCGSGLRVVWLVRSCLSQVFGIN